MDEDKRKQRKTRRYVYMIAGAYIIWQGISIGIDMKNNVAADRPEMIVHIRCFVDIDRSGTHCLAAQEAEKRAEGGSIGGFPVLNHRCPALPGRIVLRDSAALLLTNPHRSVTLMDV